MIGHDRSSRLSMSVGDGENDVITSQLDRCLRNDQLYHAHAKVQLIPLVFLPDGKAVRNSTPILEPLEADRPTPSLHPTDPGTRFLSELLEEYGDEWVNKLMFHQTGGSTARRLSSTQHRHLRS